MHLDLQSIVNYITIGIILFFLIVTIISISTKKIVTQKRRKEEERLQLQAQKQYYSSSKVHTFSIPSYTSTQNPSAKPFEEQTKRFIVINDSFSKTYTSFTHRTWN